MAVVKHVQLPDESVVDINDVRVVSDAIVYYGSDEGSATNVDTQYEETANKVTSMSASSTNTQYPSAKAVYDALATKQATLVSGTNIKTINNQSLLGSGNITIQGGGGSGGIQGVKENGTLLTPDANSVVDVTVPTKIYERDIEDISEPVSNEMFQSLWADIDAGISPIIRITRDDPDMYMDQWDWVYLFRRTVDFIPSIRFLSYDENDRFCFMDLISNIDIYIRTVGFQDENNRRSSWSATPSNENYPSEKLVKDSLDAKQATLVSGTNIKTINSQSILGSGNINISASTSDCVHVTGNESVAGNKTFTDNIGVVDADHIVYSGGGGGGGFTRATAFKENTSAANSIAFTGLSGEPKAFVVTVFDPFSTGAKVVAIVGDSTGLHGVYNTGSQHNYSAGFTKSYSNGTLTVNAPSGVTFAESTTYVLVYYYGDGALTFKTSTIQPGSGVTAVTFTGTDLTEMPVMYATFLETAVNNESYRRVACYTNSSYDVDEGERSFGATFFSNNAPADTTSSFTVTYQTGYSAGLNINSGGTNAGGYFHNPGTYVLYYLMSSDVGSGGGGGGFQSLGDELDDIRDTISGIETLLAAI